MRSQPKHINLALSGGGVQGIYQVGVIAALMDNGYVIENVAGTSVGSMIAAALAAGMTPAEIKGIIGTMPYPKLMDKPSWLIRLPIAPIVAWAISPLVKVSPKEVGIAFAGLMSNGAYEGEFLEAFTTEMLERYGKVKTFGDLPKTAPGLAIVAHDYKKAHAVVFPRDFKLYHLNPSEQTIASAVRASASIFLFYKAKVFTDPVTLNEYPVVDGGVSDGYPYETARDMNPSIPTIGILLGKAPANEGLPVRGFLSGLRQALTLTTSNNWGRINELLETEPAHSHTIRGMNLATYMTNFNPTPEQIESMWQQGYRDGTDWIYRQKMVDFPDQEVA